MAVLEKLTSALPGANRTSKPVGSIRVVDPSPLNWLYITYNTVEELVRVTPGGKVRPAAMGAYTWLDDRTLEIKIRGDEVYPNGETMTAASVKQSFDEQFRWAAPHPPGTHFNIDQRTECEIVDESTVRLHLPEVDGLVLGKLRATHIMNERFWRDIGFGYDRQHSGEGHW